MIQETEDGVTLAVRVVPRAKKDEVVGVEGDCLKIRLKAPPVEGKANAALVEFLAGVLGVARRDVEILRGEKGRGKVVRVRNCGVLEIKRALGIE